MKSYSTIGEELHEFIHESGLRVYVLPKRGFGKSYALFAADFGSVNNNFTVGGTQICVPDGVAHFLEHKLFEEEEGNVFERFSALGASANAFTSFDMTAYLFSATSNFYEALEVLIKFVQNPYFTAENVEKEKGIIGQEIDMYRDDPSWNCFFNSLRSMYINHPIQIDIAGSAESIAQIDEKLLYQCYNAFYAPENMILFVAGDIEPEKVQKIVEKTAVIKKTQKVEFSLPDEPLKIKTADAIAEFMVSRPLFSLCFKEMPTDNPVYAEAVYAVLGALLFGKSTKLYKELYDNNLISDSFSFEYASGRGYAFLQLEGESPDPNEVRARVFKHIATVRNEGVEEEDFIRAKRSVYGASIRLMDNVERIAHNFVPMAFRGGDFLTYPDEIRNLELSDVMKILKEGLKEERCVLSVVKPCTEEAQE